MGTKFNMGLPVKFEGHVTDCRSVFTFWDDFLSYRGGTVDAAKWLETETTGTITSVAATDTSQEFAGGLVALTTEATSTDVVAMTANGEHFQIDQGYPLYYECRFSITNTGYSGAFLGLTDYAVGEDAFRTPDSPAIGFKPNEDAMDVVTVNAGGTNTDADLCTIADNIWYRAAFYYDGDNTVTFYLATADGEFEAIDTVKLDVTADYVPQDLFMTPNFTNECFVAGASTMYVDYVLVQQARCLAPE